MDLRQKETDTEVYESLLLLLRSEYRWRSRHAIVR